MPLYEYRCRACGHQFEKIQKFSDPPLASCPECGGEVEKLLSAPAIQFKGAGWYITDYARKGASDGASSAPADDSKPAPSAASKDGASKSDTAGGTAAKADAPAKPAPAKPAKAD